MWRGRGAMLIQLFCLSSPSQPSPGSPAPNTCSEPTDLAQPTSWPDQPKIWPNQIRFLLPKPTSNQNWHTITTYIYGSEPGQCFTIGCLTSHCFPNLHLIRGNTLEFVPVNNHYFKSTNFNISRKSHHLNVLMGEWGEAI